MLAFGSALALAGLLAAPHLMPQDRLSASGGIFLWMSVLLLRAALAISLAVVVVFFLPATELFSILTHWCFHAVIPFFATHLGFDGHSLGDAAILVPALVTAASFLSVGFGAWRGARAVRRWLKSSSIGPGPEQSLIVGGPEVVVAAAGLRSPRVIVSAGALLNLDDDELSAGLQHEWGHVRRGHRYVLLLAHACRAVSRFLPGGAAAVSALELHLERDADDYAVSQTGDRLALASAICKAAGAEQRLAPSGLGVSALAGSGVPERLRRLTRDSSAKPSRALARISRIAAVAMLALTLGFVAATPTLADAGIHQLAKAASDRNPDCE